MIAASGYTVVVGLKSEESAKKVKAHLEEHYGFLVGIIQAKTVV